MTGLVLLDWSEKVWKVSWKKKKTKSISFKSIPSSPESGTRQTMWCLLLRKGVNRRETRLNAEINVDLKFKVNRILWIDYEWISPKLIPPTDTFPRTEPSSSRPTCWSPPTRPRGGVWRTTWWMGPGAMWPIISAPRGSILRRGMGSWQVRLWHCEIVRLW